MTRLEYLFSQYESILGWYKQAEDKSKFLVTINTIVAGVVNGLVFVAADKAASVRAVLRPPLLWVLLLATATWIGSCIFILRAVWARYHGKEPQLKEAERLWFFGHIAGMTREEHQAAVQTWTEEQMQATMTAQNHVLAGNVRKKFDALNWAII